MPTILVADDSIAVRKVAERLLTEAGLGVTLAANGEEALAYLAKERPDVVVSDVIMPDKSGYEVCAFVRGSSMLAATPVLLISGIVNDEVTKQAESCRADGILKKPFQGSSLKDRVLELLAKRQQQAPTSAPKSTSAQTASATVTADRGPQAIGGQLATDPQTALHLKEMEDQLRAERARAEGLSKRVAELEVQAGQANELATLLQTERRRITELEAALHAERETGAQLVQQLTALEQAAPRATQLEELLAAEQQKGIEIAQRLHEIQQVATNVQEIEALLATERDRNRLLAHRVSETEQIAENATKRFEEMVRKLGDIAGLASQLGNVKGTS